MKIEMGESLFYSWLRHVKECQIVQTNWTTSQQWQLMHEEELEHIMSETDRLFRENSFINGERLRATFKAEAEDIGMNADQYSAHTSLNGS